MTAEHRLFIALGDIRGITLECKHCATRLSISPENVDTLYLDKCPVCGHRWLSTASGAGKVFSSSVVSLLAGLRGACETQQDDGDSNVGVRVFFEVDDSGRADAT